MQRLCGRHHLYLLACSLSMVMATRGADAADNGPEPTTQSSDKGIVDIIVTAQKRSENVQHVALAVTAVTGAMLTERHITDVSGLTEVAPNVTFNSADGETRVGIRGITFDNIDSTAAEARVAYHLDGIYLSRSGNITGTFFDIDRVEVLRGPQGTLFGRNAIAGSVNVITKNPTDSFQGYVQGDVGNYDAVNLQAAISGPIAEGLSFRIAGETMNHGGYGENLTDHQPLDNLHQNNLRAKLKYAPASNFTLVLSADYYRKADNSGLYFGDYALPRTVPPGGGLVTPAGQPRDSYADTTTMKHDNFYGFGGQANWGISQSLSLALLTSYRHGHESIQWDADYTNLPLLSPALAGDTAAQFSQEARLQQEFSRGHVMVGLYYFSEHYVTGTHVPISLSLFGGPNFLSNGTIFGGTQNTSAIAGFAEGTYDVTSALHLTLGARYGSESKHAFDQYSGLDLGDAFDPSATCRQPCNLGNLPSPIAVAPGAKKRFNNFSPKATLQYDIDRTKNVYLTYSRGYKSGGFNLGEDVSGQSFNPETLTDYEGGFKGDFLDRRLRTNLAGFFYRYKNLQVSQVLADLQSQLVNAAGAQIYGAEAEITALPTEHLRFDFAGSLMKSKFTDFLTFDPTRANGPNGNPSQPFNLAGNQLPSAPSYTLNYGVQYSFTPAWGDITLRAEASSVSKIYYDQFNNDRVAATASTRENLYLNYRSRSDLFYGSLFVRNLTNVFRISGALVSTGVASYPVLTSFTAPRTFGVMLGRRF